MDIHVFIASGAIVPMILGMIFAFSDGYRDSSTIVATVVSTRALTPNVAFSLCALFEFCGALFIGSAVASTIGRGIFAQELQAAPSDVLLVLTAALIAAIAWGILSWWRAWPTSNSHAIMAGLAGAGWARWGASHIQNKLIMLVVVILIASPIIGFIFSICITGLLRWVGSWFTVRIKPVVEGFHVFSCLSVACAHGSNDGQLAMGVLLPAMGLVPIQGVPISLRLMVAAALSFGVLLGGRRILKKLGMKFYRIRDAQGLGAQFTSAATILACGVTGFPASTTQVIAGSIVGAGVAKNPRMVRWPVVKEIMMSWLITFPAVAALSFLVCKSLKVGLRWGL